MQISELSVASLPNPPTAAQSSTPEMGALQEVASNALGLASALGMDGWALSTLAKEGTNHLGMLSLSGSSVKDSRQLQYAPNGEHAQEWGHRMAKELMEVIGAAEKALRLKTTEAAEAKRLLKEAKRM